jgi:hypothetical protein
MKKLITIMALALCSVVSADSAGSSCATLELPKTQCDSNPVTLAVNSYNRNPQDYATNVTFDKCSNTAKLCFVPKGACTAACNQPVDRCGMVAQELNV